MSTNDKSPGALDGLASIRSQHALVELVAFTPGKT